MNATMLYHDQFIKNHLCWKLRGESKLNALQNSCPSDATDAAMYTAFLMILKFISGDIAILFFVTKRCHDIFTSEVVMTSFVLKQ